MERIALIAHDRKKDDLVDFVKNHRNFFEKYLLQKLKIFFQNFCVLNISRVDF